MIRERHQTYSALENGNKTSRIVHLSNLPKFLYFLAALLSISTPSSARDSQRHVFKIATLAPDRSVWMKTYQEIANEVASLTNGVVKFKCYPGGIQGDELTVIRKIRIKQLQGAGFSGTGLSQICPDSTVMQLPLMFNTQEEVDYVFPKMEHYLKSICRENGYEVLGWPSIGFSYLFSKDEIADMSSFRLGKPWLLEDDIVTKSIYDAAGVAGIPTSVGDVLTGLRSGLIHTVFSPPVAIISLQWFSRINYMLDMKLLYSFGTFVLVKEKWDRIPVPFQKKIRDVCARHFATLNEKILDQNQEAVEVLRGKRVRVINPSKKGMSEFKQVSNKVANTLAGKAFSEKSFKLLSSLLAEYHQNPTSQ